MVNSSGRPNRHGSNVNNIIPLKNPTSILKMALSSPRSLGTLGAPASDRCHCEARPKASRAAPAPTCQGEGGVGRGVGRDRYKVSLALLLGRTRARDVDSQGCFKVGLRM